MKKVSLLTLFCFLIMQAYSQAWKAVDIKKTVTEPQVVAANDGSLYVAGIVSGKTHSVNIYKFDGKAIQKIYEPDFIKPHMNVSIGLGADNMPIVAYTENDVPMVKRYDGKGLVDVAAEAPAPKSPNYYKMATDKAGVPYVCYMKDGFFYITKLTDGKWEQLVEVKQMGDYRVAFDSKNIPYFMFKDKRFVKKLEDGGLVDVGATYYNMSINEFNFALDNKDVPYVTYGAFENGDIKIAKLDGQVWKPIADPNADSKVKSASSPVIIFDKNNTLYFACAFRSLGYFSIKRLEGDAWMSFQAGIDDEDIKNYEGAKYFSYSPSTNTLYFSRPMFVTKLK